MVHHLSFIGGGYLEENSIFFSATESEFPFPAHLRKGPEVHLEIERNISQSQETLDN
jgi:hypothetical protein